MFRFRLKSEFDSALSNISIRGDFSLSVVGSTSLHIICAISLIVLSENGWVVLYLHWILLSKSRFSALWRVLLARLSPPRAAPRSPSPSCQKWRHGRAEWSASAPQRRSPRKGRSSSGWWRASSATRWHQWLRAKLTVRPTAGQLDDAGHSIQQPQGPKKTKHRQTLGVEQLSSCLVKFINCNTFQFVEEATLREWFANWR